jgi:adenosine deaminase CECR1
MDSENILWEAEEAVPQTQDAFIQRFLDGRDSLIQREVSQRHGQAPCPTSLTHFS